MPARRHLPKALLRCGAFVILTLVTLGLFALLYAFGKRTRLLVRRFWCRSVCAVMNIQVVRAGRPFRGCPTVYVSNHVSYIDILAIGSMVDATFIAKSEVAGWPFFGHLAKLVGTMFVRRHWRQALLQRNALAARMRQGEDFVLFGEGTSSNGMTVRPFKTSLLSVAEPWVVDRPVAIQPITLVYYRVLDGTLLDATNCALYAWWGNAKLMPHLWRIAHLPGVELRMVVGEPVFSWSVDNRKVLGRQLRQEVLANVHAQRRHTFEEPDSETAPATA